MFNYQPGECLMWHALLSVRFLVAADVHGYVTDAKITHNGRVEAIRRREEDRQHQRRVRQRKTAGNRPIRVSLLL